MKHLIIIGGGGMGKTVYCIAKECIGYGTEFDIKGYLDDNIHSMDGYKDYPPILGGIDYYKIEPNDVFISSIGNVNIKRKLCSLLELKGAQFINLIHPTAIIRQNAKIGEGSIIADYAHVGAESKIGKHCLIQSFCVIGHDCTLGDFVRIDTHAVCVGGVIVEENVMVHTGAVLNHKVVVEKDSCIGATSFVIRKVKKGTTVFGNPAKKI
jgi:sugar O-acyltransferase (sialic acid O-acetyltransferase NeuD family)